MFKKFKIGNPDVETVLDLSSTIAKTPANFPFSSLTMSANISDEEIPDEEIEVLAGFLSRVKGGDIPNVEALDGFLTALVISPDLVKPSEFTDVITKGGTPEGDLVFESTDEAQQFFSLLMAHWNRINRAFRSGDIYMPLLFEDANGEVRGNDWARGFLKGTHLRHEDWMEVSNSEEHGGPFVYIWLLVYEDDPDPKIRSNTEPFTSEQRDTMIGGMTAGATQLYDYFRKRPNVPPKTPQRGAPWADPHTASHPGIAEAKVGRNDPCPCGSGKKFKKCCGFVTLH